MAIESTGVALSSTFYLRNFYKADMKAFKASVRKDYTKNELAYEDGLALKRAASKLSSYKYSDDENESNLKSGILAYADVYNNAIDSTSDNENGDIAKYAKKLKKLATRYADELEDIGITVDKKGKMKVNENLIKSASLDDIKKVFGRESGFTSAAKSYANALSGHSKDALYADLTGAGGNLNITL